MNRLMSLSTPTLMGRSNFDATGYNLTPTLMPSGDWTDPGTGIVWTEAWANDFDTAQPQSDTLWDPASGGQLPVGNAYRDIVSCYERPISTTSGAGRYYAKKTTWVENSRFVINMHKEVIPETGVMTPLGGTVVPTLPSYYSKFIRVQWRYQVTYGGTTYPYGSVFQGIRAQGSLAGTNTWPDWGEHDFPEGTVNNRIEGNFHPAQTTNTHTTYTTAVPVFPTAERTYTSQWEPNPLTGGADGWLRWWVGDELIMNRTTLVSVAGPMVWMMQCGDVDANVYPISDDSFGRIEIPWIKIWKHPSGTI